jgi:hypothetical protein
MFIAFLARAVGVRASRCHPALDLLAYPTKQTNIVAAAVGIELRCLFVWCGGCAVFVLALPTPATPKIRTRLGRSGASGIL